LLKCNRGDFASIDNLVLRFHGFIQKQPPFIR